MSEAEQQYWRAKRLMTVAAKAICHASKQIRNGIPATHALNRSRRLGDIALAEWKKVQV